MSTPRPRYLNTDVPGGSGTGLDMANAYPSMAQLEAAEDDTGDLVTRNEKLVIYSYATAGTADTAAVDFSGWTTNRTNDQYIEISSPQKTTQIEWDDSIYRLLVTDNHALTVTGCDVAVVSLQIRALYAAAASKRCVYCAYTATAKTLEFKKTILDASGANSYSGIYIEDADYIVDLDTCIIQGDSEFSGNGIYGNGTVTIRHCTINKFYTGINRSSGTWVATNDVVFGNFDDFVGTITIDYCASDDGDGTNAIAPSGGSWANEFTDAAGEDYTPKDADANIYQAGADLDTATDHRGTAYHATTPTVGAFEMVSSGIVIFRRRREGY